MKNIKHYNLCGWYWNTTSALSKNFNKQVLENELLEELIGLDEEMDGWFMNHNFLILRMAEEKQKQYGYSI